jgi:hypothetical protein
VLSIEDLHRSIYRFNNDTDTNYDGGGWEEGV